MFLETISPIHIGSGNQLSVNLDFAKVNGKLSYIDKDKFFEDLSKNPGLVDKYFTNSRIDFKKFCEINGLKYSKYTSDKLKTEVREFIPFINELIKDGNGNPYIPGSSLKGSIRSDLIAFLFDDDNFNSLKQNYFSSLQNKKERAGEKIVESLLSTAPSSDKASNYNLMRALQSNDVYFENPEVKVYKTRIISLGNEDGTDAHWKNFPHKDNPMQIYYEAFTPDNIIEDDLFTFNHLFSNKNDGFSKLQFADKYSEIFEYQAGIINLFAEDLIQEEIDFLENISSNSNSINLERILSFYQSILDDIKNDSDYLYLRVGHGSGWNWMTRDLVKDINNEDEFMKVRNKYKLGKFVNIENGRGKRPFSIFPKSRKFIVDKNNKPIYPMGWIKLSP